MLVLGSELCIALYRKIKEVTTVQSKVNESSRSSDQNKVTRLTIRMRMLQLGDTCVEGGASLNNEVQQLVERRSKKKRDASVSEQLENEDRDTHNLLYVDQVKCNTPQVPRQCSVIRAWSMDLLRIREEEELATGGFGLDESVEPYDGNLENVVSPLQHNDIQVYMKDVNETYKQLTTLKTELERTLGEASMKYPKARDIIE
ncbi:hypothetical protein L6452_06736 [Arctium lappa]|uniref:Uncharacterized protein n=1 Tax=Arctium lappa TaxID=4217 RepID=A0ACB9EKI5_ARCLA|nr:hypothetical protein L6452_06736 [Arctium lappa]